MKIPIKYVIELGLIRKMNICAKCGNKMNIKNYSIQLCSKCREKELNKEWKRLKLMILRRLKNE